MKEETIVYYQSNDDAIHIHDIFGNFQFMSWYYDLIDYALPKFAQLEQEFGRDRLVFLKSLKWSNTNYGIIEIGLHLPDIGGTRFKEFRDKYPAISPITIEPYIMETRYGDFDILTCITEPFAHMKISTEFNLANKCRFILYFKNPTDAMLFKLSNTLFSM